MKKTIAILLLFSYIFSFTEIRELKKLPAFIEHYKEHKAENNQITLLGFITLHYLNGSQKDADYTKDMKLPFKTHDFSCYNFTIQDLPKIFDFYFSEVKIFEIKNKNFYYFLNFSEGKTFSFYPPPKYI
ncbi:hypothetical protein GCM10010992_16270 [Cloacibacterium rupense]|uniref:Uncharacterized protein n=1 Tax=Cloacibacterium rupense TaxID=517423 RepID=A0ABQ2NJW9_9FLAO|nr:hypothetical protein [Cloacibacterium rupense]GGP04355.1 hypothetical protein GCM10010992_16270 [Cloacibacterium rupense]